MRSAAHDTALFLVAQSGFGSFGGSDQWALYVDREPLAPDDVVTVYNTGGMPDVLITRVEQPTVQVRVRSASAQSAWEKAQEAVDLLQAETGLAVTGGRVVQWVAMGRPLQIMRDDMDRAVYTVNFRVMRDKFPGNPWSAEFSEEFG